MKQKEKLDAILQFLYSRRHERIINLQLKSIMDQLNIYESETEVSRLAEDLNRDKLAVIHRLSGGRDHIHSITPEGIDYCEGDSYSQPGTPVTSLHITVKGNALIGNNNSNIRQTITYSEESEDLLRKISEGIRASSGISEEQKEEAMECVSDIEEKINAKKPVSKYQWSNLLSCTANITQVAGFAAQLAQLSGYLP